MAAMAAPETTEERNLYAEVPLDAARRDIRLLALLPGRMNDELQANLYTVTTEGHPPYYEALSYTWGSGSEHRTILVNHKYQIGITNNLFRALRAMRKRRKPRTMWVDALCINQSNLNERSQQVAVMGRIYGSASCVNIWLGEPGAIKCHERLSFLRRIYWLLYKPFFSRSMFLEFKVAFEISRNIHWQLEEAMLNTHPLWYSRAWVIQEYGLSQQAVFWSGQMRVKNPSATLLLQYKPFGHTGNQVEHIRTLCYRLLLIGHDAWPRGRRLHDFSVLCQIAKSSEAFDPRDLVYSVLPLMRPALAQQIGVNYTLSCPAVYAKTTFVFMKSDVGFGVFCYVNTHGSRLEGLPSWAVDFTSRELGGELMDLRTRPHDQLQGSVARKQSPHEHGREDLAWDSENQLLKFVGIRSEVIGTVLDFFGEAIERSRIGPWTTQWDSPNEESIGVYSVLQAACMDAICEMLAGIRSDLDLQEAELEFVEKLLEMLHSLFPTLIEDIIFDDLTIRAIVITWSKLRAGLPGMETDRDKELENAKRVMKAYYDGKSIRRACLFTTTAGAIGLAPRDIIAGDVLVCVPGFGCMIVLRPIPFSNNYTFRGLAFVYGVDAAKAWQQADGSKKELEEFVVE